MKQLIYSLILLTVFVGCKKKESEPDYNSPPIKNLTVPDKTVSDSSTVKILGEGFEAGDIIEFALPAYGTDPVDKIVAAADGISFFIPAEWEGTFDVRLKRSNKKWLLGKIKVGIGPKVTNVVLPTDLSENVLEITGQGFTDKDVVVLIGNPGEKRLSASTTFVSSEKINISIPANASGLNDVYISKGGIDVKVGQFNLPVIPVIENIVMPQGVMEPTASVEILGTGFQSGDIIYAGPSEDKVYPATMQEWSGNTIKFYLPKECIKGNNLIYVSRGTKFRLGTVTIRAVAVGDDAYGGRVFYVDENGHGLVVSHFNFAQQAFGPSDLKCDPATVRDFGKGQENTDILLDAINKYRQSGKSYPNKTAAEMANEHTEDINGTAYNDWYLPSFYEMKTLYMLCGNAFLADASKPFFIPGVRHWDQYMTSTELNAYLPEQLVQVCNFWWFYRPDMPPGIVDPTGAGFNDGHAEWKHLQLGLLVIRSF